jgi:hypothetical protein
MQVGTTLPVMEPDLDAVTLESWARTVDEGPFSSLCFGERSRSTNPLTLTLTLLGGREEDYPAARGPSCGGMGGRSGRGHPGRRRGGGLRPFELARRSWAAEGRVSRG